MALGADYREGVSQRQPRGELEEETCSCSKARRDAEAPRPAQLPQGNQSPWQIIERLARGSPLELCLLPPVFLDYYLNRLRWIRCG